MHSMTPDHDAHASLGLIRLTEEHFDNAVALRTEAVIERYASSPDTYVFVEGPRWSTQGHDRIASGWRAYSSAPFQLTSWRWTEGPRGGGGEDFGFTAGIVELKVRSKEGEHLVVLRATHVYRREASGVWKIVHEHLSQPAADPYGTGDWLKAGTVREE
jgi:ketosteroid isomerase-like protein